TWTFTYDDWGHITTMQDPRSKLTTFTYLAPVAGTSAGGLLTGISRPDGTTETVSPLVQQGLGNLTYVNPVPPVLAAQAQSTYTDPRGNSWKNSYDWLGFGRATQAVDPLTDTTVTYRDGNGLAYLKSDALGNRTRYNFDSQGNTTKITYADDSVQ